MERKGELADHLCESAKVERILRISAGQELEIEDISTLAQLVLDRMIGEHTPYSRKHVLVSMGHRGVLWRGHCGSSPLEYTHDVFPPAPVANQHGRPLVTNGAGDAFSGGFVANLARNQDFTSGITAEVIREAVHAGLEAARNRIARNSGL
jgi:sugar/nucleoside kinase (ribokinase family)